MRSKYRFLAFLLTLIALVAGGCAGPTAEFLAENYLDQRPTTVAVLPLANETTDMDAPILMRMIIQNELVKNGYDTLSLATIDSKLQEEGITEGGQLGSISDRELADVIDADAVIKVNIVDFRHLTTGIYNERKVSSNIQLVNLEQGNKLWEAEVTIAKRQLALDAEAIRDALITNIATRVIEKWTRKPLYPESLELVATQFATLPWGPNKAGYPSWLWSNPGNKIGASFIYGYPHIIGIQLNSWSPNLGLQGNWSILTKSINILYPLSVKGIRKNYVGVRIGSDTVFGDFLDTSNEFGLSIFAGMEWLRWKYGGMLSNTSFSLDAGLTLAGLTGMFFNFSSGYYFN